jgi:hypothetical protein
MVVCSTVWPLYHSVQFHHLPPPLPSRPLLITLTSPLLHLIFASSCLHAACAHARNHRACSTPPQSICKYGSQRKRLEKHGHQHGHPAGVIDNESPLDVHVLLLLPHEGAQLRSAGGWGWRTGKIGEVRTKGIQRRKGQFNWVACGKGGGALWASR